MFVSELGGSTSEDVEFSWLKTRLGGHQFLGRIAISLIYLFESILIYLFYLDIFLISWSHPISHTSKTCGPTAVPLQVGSEYRYVVAVVSIKAPAA